MPQWRPDYRPCPLCESTSAHLLGARGGRAHRDGKGIETSIVRCHDCHGVYPRPTMVPESNPYVDCSPDCYFEHHESGKKVLQGEQLAAFAESVLGRPGRMLELGCGRGELLRGAANRGWKVRGVEMTETFARIARDQHNVETECVPVETSAALDETYDFILLAAILEHLYEPVRMLKRVQGALRPGGLIFIDVPNECSLMTRIGNAYMRLRGTDWAVNLSPTFSPFHVVGFCPTSLRRLLGRTGFEPLMIQLYRLNLSLPPKRGFVGRVERIGLDTVLSCGSLIGMGAGITCWASRVR